MAEDAADTDGDAPIPCTQADMFRWLSGYLFDRDVPRSTPLSGDTLRRLGLSIGATLWHLAADDDRVDARELAQTKSVLSCSLPRTLACLSSIPLRGFPTASSNNKRCHGGRGDQRGSQRRECDRSYSARGHPRPTPTSRRSALGIPQRRNPKWEAPASRDPEPMGSGPLHPRRQVRLWRERPTWVHLRRHLSWADRLGWRAGSRWDPIHKVSQAAQRSSWQPPGCARAERERERV